MKIYIAHNYDAREMLRKEVIPLMEAAGHVVTSRWITDDSHSPKAEEGLRRNKMVAATLDIQDLLCADLCVFYAHDFQGKSGRGKWVELGVAIASSMARKKRGPNGIQLFAESQDVLVIVDAKEDIDKCVFFHHPEVNVRTAKAWKEQLAALAALAEQRRNGTVAMEGTGVTQ